MRMDVSLETILKVAPYSNLKNGDCKQNTPLTFRKTFASLPLTVDTTSLRRKAAFALLSTGTS